MASASHSDNHPVIATMIHDNIRLNDIVYRPISELKVYDRRLKTHNEDTILALMASLRVFSLVSPLPIDTNGIVIDGEALLEAARRLGMATVPTVLIDHLSADQIRLLRLTLKARDAVGLEPARAQARAR